VSKEDRTDPFSASQFQPPSASAAIPEPVGIGESEDARAPAVVLHPGSLGRHVAGRRVRLDGAARPLEVISSSIVLS